jgi:hypothetical protein
MEMEQMMECPLAAITVGHEKMRAETDAHNEKMMASQDGCLASRNEGQSKRDNALPTNDRGVF